MSDNLNSRSFEPSLLKMKPFGNQRRLEETDQSCGRWFARASDQGAGWCRRKWPGTAESQTR